MIAIRNIHRRPDGRVHCEQWVVPNDGVAPYCGGEITFPTEASYQAMICNAVARGDLIDVDERQIAEVVACRLDGIYGPVEAEDVLRDWERQREEAFARTAQIHADIVASLQARRPRTVDEILEGTVA